MPKSLPDGAVIQRPLAELVIPAKPVLFLVGMFHKEALQGSKEALPAERDVSFPAQNHSALRASGGSMDPAVCHNSKSCRHNLGLSIGTNPKREHTYLDSVQTSALAAKRILWTITEHTSKILWLSDSMKVPLFFFSPLGDKCQSEMGG